MTMKAREVIAKVLDHCDECPDSDDVLEALSAAGLVIVPREPTEEMVRIAIDADDKRTGAETCKHLYRSMLKAYEEG